MRSYTREITNFFLTKKFSQVELQETLFSDANLRDFLSHLVKDPVSYFVGSRMQTACFQVICACKESCIKKPPVILLVPKLYYLKPSYFLA